MASRDKGWVLIWKKIWDADFLQGRNKTNRIIIWIWLLTHCDYETGVVTFGRYEISRDTGLSDQQTKRVMLSFRAYATNDPTSDVTYKATSEFTTITIKNWAKYQRRSDQLSDQLSDQRSDFEATNKRPTKRPLIKEPYKELKNKEDKEPIMRNANAISREKGINFLIGMFKPVNPSYERLFENKTQRATMERLIAQHTFPVLERLLTALPGLVANKYAPRITTPLQLESKFGELILFAKQEGQNKYKSAEFRRETNEI